MTPAEPAELFQATEAALGRRFRLERLVAANVERSLFVGLDLILNRRVSVRVNFYSGEALRAWFLREAEALARLDHPAIRHVYDVGVVGDLAYRIGNWIEGEGLHEAVARGPRPIPDVHNLARFLLNGLEHAHTRGILVRRLVPSGLLVSPGGRGTLTDLRFCSLTLPAIPAGELPSGLHFMAPEVRDGQPGDPASDVYGAGAVLYYAITGVEPSAVPAEIVPRDPAPRGVPARTGAGADARAARNSRQTVPHRDRDAGGLCVRGRGPLDRDAPGGDRVAGLAAAIPLGNGKSGCAGRWETTTNCSRSSGPAASDGSTGCAISTSSAASRSRCCIRS